MDRPKFILISQKPLSKQVIQEAEQAIERFSQVEKARFLLIDGTEFDVIRTKINCREVNDGPGNT